MRFFALVVAAMLGPVVTGCDSSQDVDNSETIVRASIAVECILDVQDAVFDRYGVLEVDDVDFLPEVHEADIVQRRGSGWFMESTVEVEIDSVVSTYSFSCTANEDGGMVRVAIDWDG